MPTPTRPPGVYDRLPADAAYAAAISAELSRTLSRFGYQSVETPLIEYAELFLTKSGDDAINRLFTFELYGRQLCLRSEFTASAARLYVERFQHAPKPIRWQFNGPVFRYKSPQRSHSRQFTMLGAELIGAASVSADAETLGLAARGLFAVGVRDWTLNVGHVGLVGLVLDRFGLDRRTRRFMLGQIENLRRADRGRAYVEAQFEQLYALLPQQLERLEHAASNVSHGDMLQALQLLLESANLGTPGSGRTHEDVARRLLTKQQRATQRGQVTAALDYLERFTAIEGTPAEAFAAMDALLAENANHADSAHTDAINEAARQFRATLDLLPAYEVPVDRVRVQMGLARGLNYYTGIVFEIHAQTEDGNSPFSNGQLCGGGRYDDLLRVLGAAQDTPAIGFAYGVERLMQEARRAGYNAPEHGNRALVVPVEETDSFAAVQIATTLRDHWPVELFMPPTRNLSQALAYADKQAIPYVVIVGEAERAAGNVLLRDMQTGTQSTHALADLPEFAARLTPINTEALS